LVDCLKIILSFRKYQSTLYQYKKFKVFRPWLFYG